MGANEIGMTKKNVLHIRPMISFTNRAYIVKFYALSPVSSYLSADDIKGFMEEGYDIHIDPGYNGKHKGKLEAKASEPKSLLRILEGLEKLNSHDDKNFLNRIIYHGGFSRYIRKLQGKLYAAKNVRI